MLAIPANYMVAASLRSLGLASVSALRLRQMSDVTPGYLASSAVLKALIRKDFAKTFVTRTGISHGSNASDPADYPSPELCRSFLITTIQFIHTLNG